MTHVPGTEVPFDQPGEWESACNVKCRRCGSADLKYRTHSSSCGAWEDDEFRCPSCLHTWWVDGIDS